MAGFIYRAMHETGCLKRSKLGRKRNKTSFGFESKLRSLVVFGSLNQDCVMLFVILCLCSSRAFASELLNKLPQHATKSYKPPGLETELESRFQLVW